MSIEQVNEKSSRYLLGGISGIVGTSCYVLSNVIPLNHTLFYLFVMAWPVLSLIFIHSLYSYIAIKRQSIANQLAFMFATLGFALVACMISVQLAVRWGTEYFIADSGDKKEELSLLLRSIRLVDQGIDVAWDFFIGTALIFLFFALKVHPGFRLLWALPAVLLAVALMILNVISFPWPPDSVGLFDVGPLIGIYIIVLSVRLIGVSKKDSAN